MTYSATYLVKICYYFEKEKVNSFMAVFGITHFSTNLKIFWPTCNIYHEKVHMSKKTENIPSGTLYLYIRWQVPHSKEQFVCREGTRRQWNRWQVLIPSRLLCTHHGSGDMWPCCRPCCGVVRSSCVFALRWKMNSIIRVFQNPKKNLWSWKLTIWWSNG